MESTIVAPVFHWVVCTVGTNDLSGSVVALPMGTDRARCVWPSATVGIGVTNFN